MKLYNDDIEDIMEKFGLEHNCHIHVSTAWAKIRHAMKEYGERVLKIQKENHDEIAIEIYELISSGMNKSDIIFYLKK